MTYYGLMSFFSIRTRMVFVHYYSEATSVSILVCAIEVSLVAPSKINRVLFKKYLECNNVMIQKHECFIARLTVVKIKRT